MDEALAWLRQRLPANWTVDRAQRSSAGPGDGGARTTDAAIAIQGGNGTFARLAVEAKRAFSPRDADRLLSGLAGSLRSLAGDIPILVVAPWLSPRTQQLLTAKGVNFLDLTGNALIKLENPALYLQAVGAARNPEPPGRGRARIRGPRAGRLMRLLADVAPPYALGEIASATGINPGYVSRLLDALDREALIEREPRGPVLSVEIVELLRRWAQGYDVFKSNDAATFLAPGGASDALQRLAGAAGEGRYAVTGSFAAVRRAPVAAPALLTAYCEEPDRVAAELGLLPADAGANVVLLRPYDPVVWTGTHEDGGVVCAAVSQIAVDCLTGNGRMPAEGEALLRWMSDDEDRWRVRSLEDFRVGDMS